MASAPSFLYIILIGLCIARLVPATRAAHAHTHQTVASPRARVFSDELQQQRLQFADTYTLIPSVATLSSAVTSVTVTITGECLDIDLLALFCFDAAAPPDTNLSFPFKFKHVLAGMQQQQLTFDVLNVRLDCSFFLLRNTTAFPSPSAFSDAAPSNSWALLSQTETLTNEVKNMCMGVHTAIAPPPSFSSSMQSIRIFFSTSLPPPLTVQYHQLSCSSPPCSSAPSSVTTSARSYSSADLCGGIAAAEGFIHPGWLHTAELDDLQPAAIYSYTISDCQSFPSNFSFQLPSPPAPDARTRFIVYGDMGKAEEDSSLENWMEAPAANTTARVAQLLQQGRAQAVLHIGDIAYAVGHASQWDEFYNFVQPVASAVPYMQAIGNHEANFPGSNSFFQTLDSAGECGVPYAMRFTGGRCESVVVAGGVDPSSLYYSFVMGSVHVAVLSTEHDFRTGGAQWRWLQGDLAAVDRLVTPWLLVVGHRPMYIDSTWNTTVDSDQYVAALLRAAIEPLLLRYKVNAAFWGHHHSFQRTCPVANEICAESSHGVVHYGVGMAGMTLSTNLMPKAPAWSLRAELVYGLSAVDAVNSTHMTIQVLGCMCMLRCF